MDIIEFIEKLLDIKLSLYQKNLIRKLYNSKNNGEKIHFIPCRQMRSFNYTTLFELYDDYIKENKK